MQVGHPSALAYSGEVRLCFSMVSVHPKFLTDGSQRKEAVVLPIDEWEKLVEELEELEDIRALDAAKSTNSEAIPFEKAVSEIESE